jgi:hypothetical protein
MSEKWFHRLLYRGELSGTECGERRSEWGISHALDLLSHQTSRHTQAVIYKCMS